MRRTVRPKTIFVRSMEAGQSEPDASIVKHLKWLRIGCLPFDIKEESFHKISVPFLMYCLTVVSYHSFYHVVFVNWTSKGPFSAALLLVRQLTYLFYYPFMLVVILMYRNEFDKSVKKLMDLQRRLEILQYNMFLPVKMYAATIICLLLVFLASLVSYYNRMKTDDPQKLIIYWFTSSCGMIVTLYQTATFSIFGYLLCCVGSCFAALARTNFRENDDVRRFVRLYNEVRIVSGGIYNSNDANVSLTIFIAFLSLVLSTGTILKAKALTLDGIGRILVSTGLLLTPCGHIIQVCHSAAKQAEKANSALVGHIYSYSHNSNFDVSYAMLHLSSPKSLSLKMCRSMVINYNLAMSMIAGYITYAIILFQMDITDSQDGTGPDDETEPY